MEEFRLDAHRRPSPTNQVKQTVPALTLVQLQVSLAYNVKHTETNDEQKQMAKVELQWIQLNVSTAKASALSCTFSPVIIHKCQLLAGIHAHASADAPPYLIDELLLWDHELCSFPAHSRPSIILIEAEKKFV